MKPKQVLISAIETEADTQARIGVSQETIDSYVAILRDAHDQNEPPPFPPVDLFFDGSSYFVGDGWHRLFAWQIAGPDCIPAIVHDGGLREALLFAAGANGQHGLMRTDNDKRRAVEIMLADQEWAAWSDRKIAEHCRVSKTLVHTVRQQAAGREKKPETSGGRERPPEKPLKRQGRDGKEYPAKPKPATPTEPETKGPDLPKLSAPYRETANELNAIRRKFEAIAEAPEGMLLAPSIQRLSGDINGVKGTIVQAAPTEICPKCNGEGCQRCARTGFWTKSMVQSQPQHFSKK